LEALLVVHGLLVLIALTRGWRALPVFWAALPWALKVAAPLYAPISFAGWWLPVSNLLVFAGTVATLGLLYTAAAEPETV
jgi:hypothetical protein